MSVRTRLTLWYIGLLAVSLAIFTVLLYSLLSSILLAVMDSRLAGRAEDVLNLMESENDPPAVMLSGKARLPQIDVFASQYYIQIVRLDSQVVQLSENLRGQRLPLPADLSVDVAAGRPRSVAVQTPHNVRLRVYSMPILMSGRPMGAIQVAESLADLDGALAVVRRALLLGSLSTLLLAALGGAILSRAALDPIKAITETAQQITKTQDLGRRIPLSDPNDELGRLVTTINDMLARLEEMFQAQQRLVADVSHDLRTPLTTIQGNLDLLRRGAAHDPEMLAECLKAISDETARMRRMITDLLLLAQADAGLKLQLQPVEVDTLLLDIYRQAQMMASGVSVRLGAEDQAMVMGDSDRLRQLLLNLVDNGLKYTAAGGEVRLTLQREAGWVKVGVMDTGIGIGPEDLPHVFERFYRADRSRTSSGGSGLGLAIARWIAEAHGGRLEVESQVGKGTSFTLWLPEMSRFERSMGEELQIASRDVTGDE